MTRSLRSVHHEEATDGEAAAFEQAFNARLERRVVERRKFVEQRRDPGRVDEQHQQVERAPEQPDVEPPEASHLRHQPEHGEQQRRADDDAERGLLDEVDDKQLDRHAVEAVLRFDHELLVERQGKVDRAGDEHHGKNHRHAVGQAVEPGAQHLVQELQPAGKGQAEQQNDLEGQRDARKTGLCDGVVGGFLMCRQFDAPGELLGNRRAMREDVSNLTVGELTADQHHQRQREKKNEGEGVGHCLCENVGLRARTDYMAQDANHLIWLDMEMTGLDPERERIIELAMIVTDVNLVTIAESPVWVVHQSAAQLDAMDDWNKATHGRSGLIAKVQASTLDEAGVEAAALAFVQQYVPKETSPMCGNSIGQDRRFMVRYLPQLEAWFHYRNLDVSTLKELCRRWKPEVAKGFVKKSDHTALADIRESIEELKYYREHFIKL